MTGRCINPLHEITLSLCLSLLHLLLLRSFSLSLSLLSTQIPSVDTLSQTASLHYFKL